MDLSFIKVFFQLHTYAETQDMAYTYPKLYTVQTDHTTLNTSRYFLAMYMFKQQFAVKINTAHNT